ncbi:MAG: UDP-N-acetylmuramate dehydrogenase [Bacteroidales bacterium]|jgi:UDP-N-acetylmuramate dehydrogenase|nr:UDP-N-acetylmuramate dehydrogenase [Bacteroidales bacterium]
MRILKNTSLKPYNTFRIDCSARTLIRVKSIKECGLLFGGGLKFSKPLLIIGGGSNLLFSGDFNGTILKPEFTGIAVEELDGNDVIVSAGAGVNWDGFVEWCVNGGISGVENLSGIPGSTGAAPVQNIGAYGVEAGDVIEKVVAVNTTDGSKRVFRNEECGFAYRASIFKGPEKGNYLIARVFFRLSMKNKPNLDYGSLREEVMRTGKPTLKNIRETILRFRQSKLPDPSVIGNAGSFFKNPLVSKMQAEKLSIKYPGLPVYNDLSGRSKIAAGWLIEHCGWKGKRVGDAGVHEKQALVLVNYGYASGKEIFELSEEIRLSVLKEFRIGLEREVELI